MELKQINLEYSLKNIPIPHQNSYLKRLISQTEQFLKRIRWKALFFEKDPKDAPEYDDKSENFGFKTSNTPPQNSDLTDFENDIYKLIGNIEFKNVNNSFQSQLSSDITKLKKSGKVIVKADKTTNLYQISKDQYNKMMNDNITKDYKKTTSDTKADIDRETKNLIKELKLEDRMEVHTTNNCFLTLKDHKDNFSNNPKCRLINPAKTDLGKVSKHLLDRMVSQIRSITGVNHWKNTAEVLSWFSDITSKQNSRFIQFDIAEFYPSITSELLDRAITYARTIINIDDSEISIIKHAKRSLLFNDDNCWVKKSKDNFDVTMGSFDGAETCELVGLYLLKQVSSIIPQQSVGLYRDDGLAVIENANGPILDRIRKDLHDCFKREGLKITVDIHAETVNFLDVKLNLKDASYRPYKKPNSTTLYIHKDSNHPPNVIQNIPEMINKRLINISSCKEMFDGSKDEYERALRTSGFDSKLEYTADKTTTRNITTRQKKRRQRKIIWYNPPYNTSVSTDIGRKFFGLLDKHFPKNHKFHKIFNRNTVKMSYSCMPNVGSILQSHNKNILNKKDVDHNNKRCNCRDKTSCPLKGECLVSSVVYEATVATTKENYRYIGLTEGTFKSRYGGHKQSFNHEKHRTSTELSKKIWDLKDDSTEFKVNWSIIQTARATQGGARTCDLCLSEKLHILKNPGTLNKRSELVSKCRHARKYLISGVT